MSASGRLKPEDLARARRHLLRADTTLAGIVRRVGPCRLDLGQRESIFFHLTRAIVHQQISGHAAKAIERRIRERFGPELRPEHVLASDDAGLRALGLSRQKIGYLRDLATKAADGLPLERLARFSEARVIETVTSVKGIGRWSADMLLMFRLRHPDVLPTGDFGIRSAMQRAWRMRSLPKPKRMLKLAEPWRPYRTVASWYLWRSLELSEEREPGSARR